MHKQVILMRQDLKLPTGKAIAQGAHAAVEAAHRATERDYKAWRAEGMAKIVVKVPDEKNLRRFIQDAKDIGLATATITDAGKTVIAPGTVTCGAIGPASEKDLDPITRDLPLM